MSKYLMGIDAGGTATKAVLFDELGNEIASSSAGSVRIKPRGKGFEEFDVDALWRSIANCIRETLDKANINPTDIAGIGVTSFGNGIVVLDKDGNVVAPGAFSHDYRANGIIEMYKEKGTYEKINEIIKGTLFAGEPGPILCWFKKHEPEVYNKIGTVLMFKDLIMYRLTNIFATDANVFGGSGMMDLEKLEYSKELLDFYEIPEMHDKLPKLALESSEVVGIVSKKASEKTGLAEGTPVVGGMMDILACLVGAGATEPGVITAIAGTWCINETQSENIIPGASANMPFLTRGRYLNCSFSGASAVNYEWFNRALGGTAKIEANERGISPYTVLDEMIDLVPIEKVQVLYHPFVAQPSVHENARANFFNIDQNTSYAEITYSIVEGVAFMHKQHINFLKKSGCEANVIRLTGGIARSKVWTRVFADVLELPIEVVDCEEVGALGVAITAGVGTGVYDSYEDAFKKAVRIRVPVMPNPDTFNIYSKRFKEWERLIEIMKIYWNEK